MSSEEVVDNHSRAAEAVTAALGGHVDGSVIQVSLAIPHFKSGKLKVLGVSDGEESKFMPGVKTFNAQGYPVELGSDGGIVLPAATPKEIVNAWSAAVKKALDNPELQQKMEETTVVRRYMDPDQYSKYWTEKEAIAGKMLPLLQR